MKKKTDRIPMSFKDQCIAKQYAKVLEWLIYFSGSSYVAILKPRYILELNQAIETLQNIFKQL